MNYDDMFPKPLEEMTDEELKETALQLKKEQKYPAITKAKDKTTDKITKMMNKISSKVDKK